MGPIYNGHIGEGTILVVEDNDGDFFLVEDFLLEKLRGAAIVRCGNFGDTVDYLNGENPDIAVILLDLHLPDARGMELVKDILGMSNNVPIIILSGYADLRTAQESLKLGVSDYLIKDDLNPEILYRALIYAKERNSYVSLLQRSTKMYQELFDFSPQPMWVFDPVSLAFLNVNKSAMATYGYDKEEFMAMTIRDIRPKEHYRALNDSIAERKENRDTPFAGIFVHTLKSGDLIQVEIYSNDIMFQGSDARLVLANDVTEKYNHIQTIEAQNARLREIAWTQSHIVRAPLSRILGIINLLEIEEGYSQDLKYLLEQLKKSGKEMDMVIQDIVERTAQIDGKHGEKH
ncbi:response regulator [Flagellimonas halotolerans]|uniref:histidine kinase n=1 Tax=Flagellimonas halotolerans TaxID=3112164 RepID=A0ABU6ISV8_9FLAO|nr:MULTISPECIES: response regulator [unclassified Allomuricauda]MEC3966228.1 response regulator [Muricauda sp. SYSU M86414]MEC4266086.1 response regulator [Muricauda sp. SYSU M84420]